MWRGETVRGRDERDGEKCIVRGVLERQWSEWVDEVDEVDESLSE